MTEIGKQASCRKFPLFPICFSRQNMSGCLSEGGFAIVALKPKFYQIIKVSGFKMMKFFLNLISKEINIGCITNLANTGLGEESQSPRTISDLYNFKYNGRYFNKFFPSPALLAERCRQHTSYFNQTPHMASGNI